ncbi:MAG: hypothetical protein OJF60_001332 [Burkholderiaceae bacterium]|jgi:hypothetical protein|nr:MAG: hypothetical protein OJF60_001332 [Burkholderiaceae bacterium]
MRLDLFHPRPEAHVRKAQEYLEEACMARIEHEAAAEHHAALAAMYAQRIARLKQQIADALMPYGAAPALAEPAPAEAPKRAAEPVVSLPRIQRTGDGG